MEDLLAALGQAPLWARLFLAFFVLMAVVMFVEPLLRQHRHRQRFDALASALGSRPPEGRGWPVSFDITVGGRAFTVEHNYIGTTRGMSYRGPRGFLITTATSLAGDRWSMHQADVEKLEGWLARLGRSARATGDQEFDRRFMATIDGLPVREGWLDAPTRAAFARFLDAAPVPGPVWIREARLRHVMSGPSKGLDAKALAAHLERQKDLAEALERTARVGP